jgi:hypothetical protein
VARSNGSDEQCRPRYRCQCPREGKVHLVSKQQRAENQQRTERCAVACQVMGTKLALILELEEQYPARQFPKSVGSEIEGRVRIGERVMGCRAQRSQCERHDDRLRNNPSGFPFANGWRARNTQLLELSDKIVLRQRATMCE